MGVVFLLGWINFFAESQIIETTYVVTSMTLLGAVLLGAVLREFSQETIDFKEIYREKDKIQKAKIIKLQHELERLSRASGE